MSTETIIETEKEAPPARPKKRSYLGRIVLVLLIAAAAVGGYRYWQRSERFESTDDAQVDGFVYAVSSRVPGTVIKLNVRDNQRVEAGTVLLELDPRDYQVAVAQAKADLAQAEADLSASRTNVPMVSTTSSNQLASNEAQVQEANANVEIAAKQIDVAQARLRSAEAMVRQAKANHDRAASDLERYRMLVAKEEISRQQFDTASAAADATNAQLEASQAQVEEAAHAVTVAQNQVAQYRAKVARAEADVRGARIVPQEVAASEARANSSLAKVQAKRADLEKAQLNLEYTIVRAPATGIVSQRNVEVGRMVQPGQPMLAVVPLEDVWVTANFKESQLANMRPGQKATVSVDAYGGKTYSGHVDSIAAATGARFSILPPENATGNYVKVVQRIPVKIVLDKGQGTEQVLRPGMSVVPKVAVQ
jgi:membrane fusion protein (multidrug efflux system)